MFLALVTPNVCIWIDGELYLPVAWFEESQAVQRKKLGVLKELTFQTKPELGWELIRRTLERHIPFQAVVMDDLYGRNEALRQKLNEAGIEYYGDIPANTKVYLKKTANCLSADQAGGTFQGSTNRRNKLRSTGIAPEK